MAEVNITSMVVSFGIMLFFIAGSVFVINSTLNTHNIGESDFMENEHYLQMQEDMKTLTNEVEDEIEDTSFLDKASNVIISTIDTVTLGGVKALKRIGAIRSIFISGEKWIKSMVTPYVPDFIINYLWQILLLIFSMAIISAWLRYKP